MLRATQDIFTSRHVSLLSQGGTIDTQQFAVEIAGATVNAGILAKRGYGTLTLSGHSAHQSTHVIQGTLAVLGNHTGSGGWAGLPRSRARARSRPSTRRWARSARASTGRASCMRATSR